LISARRRAQRRLIALELYAAEIARKIAAFSEQAALLRTEIAENGRLLDEIGQKNSGRSV
jgi:hypothetical protein